MAIYEFRCPKGHLTDKQFPIGTAPDLIDCPKCRAKNPQREHRPAKRVLQAPAAIHFKTGGFYATDVRGKLHRKRRRNPGDGLHREFDVDGARIADRL